jgi:hypothetical protein
MAPTIKAMPTDALENVFQLYFYNEIINKTMKFKLNE